MSSLLSRMDLHGRVDADIAAIGVDEAHSARISAQLSPTTVVLTNSDARMNGDLICPPMHLSIFDSLESEVRSYVRSFPVVFDKTHGSVMADEDGKEYVDFFCGAGALNYGHNNPRFKQELIAYLQDDSVVHSLDMATTARPEDSTSSSRAWRMFSVRQGLSRNDSVLLSEGVFNVLPGLLQVGLGLIHPALSLEVFVVGGLSCGLFYLALHLFTGVLQLVFAAHGAHSFPPRWFIPAARFASPSITAFS